MEQDLEQITATFMGINFNPVSIVILSNQRELPDHEPATCIYEGSGCEPAHLQNLKSKLQAFPQAQGIPTVQCKQCNYMYLIYSPLKALTASSPFRDVRFTDKIFLILLFLLITILEKHESFPIILQVSGLKMGPRFIN